MRRETHLFLQIELHLKEESIYLQKQDYIGLENDLFWTQEHCHPRGSGALFSLNGGAALVEGGASAKVKKCEHRGGRFGACGG